MTLWLKVTNDKYELPLAVSDTKKELAEMLGLKRISIRKGKSCYIKVICTDEQELTRKGGTG